MIDQSKGIATTKRIAYQDIKKINSFGRKRKVKIRKI